jgi:hypothetical protein
VSHFHQRKEKDCLNCGATVIGPYCHNCGQENIEPKESFWHLILHFFNDITHFDGKFFTTLRILLFRPGFLSKEYMSGKRVSYLNPIRMYLFTSFIFFLVFFSVFKLDEGRFDIKLDKPSKEKIRKMSDAEFKKLSTYLNADRPMTKEEYIRSLDSIQQGQGILFSAENYKSKEEYDAALKGGKKKDSWIKRQLTYKGIEINKKYSDDRAKLFEELREKFVHNFPQMLFVSLPFAALLLELLYIRCKKFYYVGHAIFTLHFYVFVFIMMLFSMGVVKLENFTHWNKLSTLNVFITITIFFYLYKSMRNFYEQGRGKTILKYFLFLFSFSTLILFLFVAFLFVTLFQV